MEELRNVCCRRPKCTVKKVKSFFPIINWLPKYRFTSFQGDLVAGFAVGLMIIPQSLAHAVIAGLQPQYGLYSSFPAMFVYLFLGTSKDVSIGSTVITALLANRYSVTETVNPNIIAALTFLVGIAMVVIALFRLGFIVRFLSYPVISAFVSASSIIIATSQLRYLFGLSKPKRQIFLKLKHFFENVQNTRPGDITMGLICLVSLLLLDYMSKRKSTQNESVPKWRKILRKVIRIIGIGRNALIAILAILISYIFSICGKGDVFRTVGHLPKGLPKPEFPLKAAKISANETISVGSMVSGFGSGIGVLPLIIVLQSIASSKALGRINRYKVDTFQEILALGLGNIFGSLFKAIPLTASFSRSAVCSSSGSKTPITGVFTSLVVILAIQFMGPVFSYAPMSSLAAIVIAAVIKLFDYSLVMTFWKLNKFDLLVWIVAFCGCLYEIEVGILLGVTASLCILMFREFNPRLKVTLDKENRKLVAELRGGVWFPGIEAVGSRISRKLEKEGDSIDVVVIDCEDMLEIDYTVIHGLQEIKADCILSNVKLEFENVHGSKIRRMLEGSDLSKKEAITGSNDLELQPLEPEKTQDINTEVDMENGLVT